MKCPKCNGTGVIKVEKTFSMTRKEMVEEKCDFCEGTGFVYDDSEVIKRLDKIIELLEIRK